MPCELCASSIITARNGVKVCANCGRHADAHQPALRLCEYPTREQTAENDLRLRIASSERPTTLPIAQWPTLLDGVLNELRQMRQRAEHAECLARSRLTRLGDLNQQIRTLTVERNHARAEAEHLRRENERLQKALTKLAGV